MRPIAEMMTFNFSLLALDQIVNHAAKYRYMSGGQIRCPMVMRGPSGAAAQVAAQHSQAFESWFAHVPGLVVVMPSTPKDAKGLLKSAIRDDNPVIFMENEVLYNLKGEVPEEEFTIPLGLADVKRAGKDVTIVAWSRSTQFALQAAELLAKDGIEAEVVDPRTLRPLDEDLIFDSVRKTNRCVVVEEGWRYAGFGAEIADRVQRECFDALDAPVIRVTAADVPMPYSQMLEKAYLPQPEKVVDGRARRCSTDDHQGRPRQALPDDGGGHHRQVEQEGGRRGQGRRRAGRDRDGQGQHGDGGPGRRRAAQDPRPGRAARPRSARSSA